MKRWFLRILGALGILSFLAGICTLLTSKSAISIIGGSDGPTSIYLASRPIINPAYFFIFAAICALIVVGIYLYKRKKSEH